MRIFMLFLAFLATAAHAMPEVLNTRERVKLELWTGGITKPNARSKAAHTKPIQLPEEITYILEKFQL